jgi:hypothetical protein
MSKFIAEIHLIIYPKDEGLLRKNINEITSLMSTSIAPHSIHSAKVMATNTTTGNYKRQPMLTFYVTNVDKESIINITIKTKEILGNYGIHVLRAKSEIQLSDKNHCITVTDDEYLECHMKIDKNIPSKARYTELANILIKYGVHLLINYDSTTVAPVTTMRCYNIDYKSFKKINDMVEKELSNNGFSIFKKHIEHGIYDDNVYTDEGWLFNGKDYKNSITEIDCKERLEIPVM